MLTAIEDDGTSKLEKKFIELAPDASLEPLLHVIEGMMRFLPSSRLSAGDALEMLEKTRTEYLSQEKPLEQEISHPESFAGGETSPRIEDLVQEKPLEQGIKLSESLSGEEMSPITENLSQEKALERGNNCPRSVTGDEVSPSTEPHRQD